MGHRNLTPVASVLSALLLLPFVAKAATNACDPASHHAVADGKTVVTKQLQQTIDACSQQGGGIVSLHKGTWLSGPLSLKNGVTLNLEKGSTLLADNSEKLFKRAFIGSKAQAGEAFILANHVSNVGVTGSGTVNGSGKELWWPEAKKVYQIVKVQGNKEYFFKHYPGIPLANGVPRPWLIEFNDVNNGHFGAILATNSPMWNIVLRNSQHISFDGTRVRNPEDSFNSDGVDVVASQHITMKHLDISTGDDDIAIKSGLANVPLIAHASSDIEISDSVIHEGHGVSVGSETANGIGKVYIHDVRFDKTLNGFRVKSARDRGAQIGPIVVNNLKMIDVQTPILFTESYTGQSGAADAPLPAIKAAPITKTTPFIHDVSITNLVAVNANIAGIFNGLPESPLKNIQLKDIDIRSKLGIKTAYAQISADNLHVSAQQGQPINQGPGTELTAN
ncbi:glycoside hydrolase family 28 protein [Celerinatantimonas sp. MCCC 1A17872]|uniref:glycoside hydrolase family 28 protein n=1 Tax=Celerinatantimonas sp. MCCC 1A17872 TaxID=3177514 RepID=UPI0038C801AA